MIYKMTLKDSVDTMTFNLLETPIVDKDIEGAVDNVTLDGNQYTDYLYLKKQYIQKWAIMCPDEYDELRGFYTRQFEDGEVPSYRVYYGANVTRDYTLNGDYFQFNAEGIETGMTLSQLTGNAEQTTYTGKNLFNFGKFISDNVSTQGVIRGTATYTSNSITLTATSNDCFTKYSFSPSLYPVIPVPQNTNVTLSWKTDNTSGTNRGVVYVFGNDNGAAAVIKYVQDRAGYCTFNTGAYTEISFRVGVATSGDTLTYSDIQVEIGSATAFEPYVGGIPSPNPDYPQDIQVLTGDSTVKITGKNLVEDTILGSSIDANGIIRSNSDFDTQVAFVIEGKTYTLSYTGGTVVGGYFATKPTINSASIDGTRIVDNNKTFVAQYTGYFTFRTNAGESNAQCERGSTATAYEPYQGQSYEVNLGKNLFGGLTPDHAEHCTYTLNGLALTITPQDTTNNTAAYFKLGTPIEAGTYTLNSQTSLSSSTQLRTASNAIAYNFGNGYSNKTFTTTATATAIAFNWLSTGSTTPFTVDLSTLQIERSSTATAYAPYFPPIELAKIGNYQDRIYKDEGKWYIEKQVGKVVLNGTEDGWDITGGGNGYRLATPDIVLTPSNELAPIVSDYYTVTTFSRIYNANIDYGIANHNSNHWLAFRNKDITSLANFKTWLGTHNTTVYYALAETTTTEITDDTLLLQLNFLASLYGGVNNISLVGTGAQGEMEVFIRDVMSVETDVVPEVPVRLTLTDDGVINACGCRRNVQLTMRETTE